MFHRENRIRKRGGDEAIRETQADALAPQEAADAEAVWRQAGRPPTALIRSRAYEIYIERNGGPGDALSDWLRAEAELLEGRGCAHGRDGGGSGRNAERAGPPRGTGGVAGTRSGPNGLERSQGRRAE